MSATVRADDPRAGEVRRMNLTVTNIVPGVMHGTIAVWWADGRHWSGSCDGRTCHEAATGCMALAREEGAE